MKKCNKCSETKELIEFTKRSISKDGLAPYCKSCTKKASSKWRKANPERFKAAVKTWHNNNKEYAKQQQKNYRHNNKEWVVKHHQCTKEWATKISGVYAIFDNECLYVGESKRINARISDHKYYTYHPESKVHKNNPIYSLLSKHSNLEFKILEETPNHKEREQYWINQLKPKYNGTKIQ